MKSNIVRKISITNLMDVLQELYNNGLDYIDLYGSSSNEEDTLSIHFTKEYMDPQYMEDYENFVQEDFSEEKINVKLTDEDLKDLI